MIELTMQTILPFLGQNLMDYFHDLYYKKWQIYKKRGLWRESNNLITFFVSNTANTFNRWVDMDSVGIKELSLHSAQDPVWVDKSDKLYTKYATLPA